MMSSHTHAKRRACLEAIEGHIESERPMREVVPTVQKIAGDYLEASAPFTYMRQEKINVLLRSSTKPKRDPGLHRLTQLACAPRMSADQYRENVLLGLGRIARHGMYGSLRDAFRDLEYVRLMRESVHPSMENYVYTMELVKLIHDVEMITQGHASKAVAKELQPLYDQALALHEAGEQLDCLRVCSDAIKKLTAFGLNGADAVAELDQALRTLSQSAANACIDAAIKHAVNLAERRENVGEARRYLLALVAQVANDFDYTPSPGDAEDINQLIEHWNNTLAQDSVVDDLNADYQSMVSAMDLQQAGHVTQAIGVLTQALATVDARPPGHPSKEDRAAIKAALTAARAEIAPEKLPEMARQLSNCFATGQYDNAVTQGRRIQCALRAAGEGYPGAGGAGALSATEAEALRLWDVENKNLEAFQTLFDGVTKYAANTGRAQQSSNVRETVLALGFLEGPARSFTYNLGGMKTYPSAETRDGYAYPNMKAQVRKLLPQGRSSGVCRVGIDTLNIYVHAELYRNNDSAARLVGEGSDVVVAAFTATDGRARALRALYEALDPLCLEAKLSKIGDLVKNERLEQLHAGMTNDEKCTEYARVLEVVLREDYADEHNLDPDAPAIFSRPDFLALFTTNTLREHLGKKGFLQDKTPEKIDQLLRYHADNIGTFSD